MPVVASKMDVAQDPEKVAALRDLAARRELPFFEISSATGQGIKLYEVRACGTSSRSGNSGWFKLILGGNYG